MKKIIAILLGLEIGLILVSFIFLTLIGYVSTGILAYLLIQIIPVKHEILQGVLGISFSIIVILISIYICLKFSKKYDNIYKWFVVLIPLVFTLTYLLFFQPVDKKKKIEDELVKYKVQNRKEHFHYKELKSNLKFKLDSLSKFLDTNSNSYLGLFASNSTIAKFIKVDTILISPNNDIGLCVFTTKIENYFYANSIYFNPTDCKIYSGNAMNSKFAEIREDALIELYYELYITNKIRSRVIYAPKYKHWNEEVPTIIESKYWNTTINEDTINFKDYGEF